MTRKKHSSSVETIAIGHDPDQCLCSKDKLDSIYKCRAKPTRETKSPRHVAAGRLGGVSRASRYLSSELAEFTLAGRQQFLQRFVPVGVTDEAERERMAAAAMKVYFMRLGKKSAAARAKKAGNHNPVPGSKTYWYAVGNFVSSLRIHRSCRLVSRRPRFGGTPPRRNRALGTARWCAESVTHGEPQRWLSPALILEQPADVWRGRPLNRGATK
jgi:hypothetical protein